MKKRELTINRMDALWSRRKALTGMMAILAGVTVGCSPIRLALDIKKEDLPDDLLEVNQTLSAFVTTIVPGIDNPYAQLIEIFYDRFYKFHKYVIAFSKDLNIRSEKRFGARFYQLSNQQRIKVVEDGLESGLVATQLYTGALFLTQIGIYSGVASNDQGCELIGFKGTYQHVPTYKDPEPLFGTPATNTGNPI